MCCGVSGWCQTVVMNDVLSGFLLGLLLGLVLAAISAAVAWRLRDRRGDGSGLAPAQVQQLLGDVQQAQRDLAEVRVAEASARATAVQLGSRVEGLEQQLSAERGQWQQREREAVAAERARATEAAERQRQQAEAQQLRLREQGQVLQALAPVSDTLQVLQRKVSELERDRAQQYGALAEQMKSARDGEQQLRATTESLASALRSNSVRGVWGETQLRRVVEAAGLLRQVDFAEQQPVEHEGRQGRVDMVVHLPGDKYLAVDAKVPFNAYLEASQIPLTATGAEAERRARLLGEHVKAVRGHIDELGRREYWEALGNSPDLVVAFIPSESLLSAALETDPSLLDYAFSRNVALASPVTLWSVLKTVAFSWQQQVLTEDAQQLFSLGRELYTRLSRLSDLNERLRRSIESTVKSYNAFSSSLERRVFVTARRLDGAEMPDKIIAEAKPIDEPLAQITAPELVDREASAD